MLAFLSHQDHLNQGYRRSTSIGGRKQSWLAKVALKDVLVQEKFLKNPNELPSVRPVKEKGPSRLSQVSNNSNGEESNALVTPEAPSKITKQMIQDSSNDDNLTISECLKLHAQNVVSPALSVAYGNRRKRKLSTITEESKRTIRLVDGVVKEVKRKNSDSVLDPLEITKISEGIKNGKASKGSVKGAAKEVGRKKAGESSNKGIDVDDCTRTTRSKTL
ncbi:hypothetical protein L1049_000623 [Liquidambar formosana]|uniref:Uncharacterized protein n=1 Tax=Liquidambar formosana TaxID=63359 RepID=A0AAP0R5H8_LIQFO